MGWFKRSPWVLHYNATSCNGCDIELIASLTPLYDLERFGIISTGNPKHADILAVTGSVNEKSRQVLQNLYDQMPNPQVVVAVGICASSMSLPTRSARMTRPPLPFVITSYSIHYTKLYESLPIW